MSMKECHYAHLDTDQEVLFCEFGGPCSKNLHYRTCWLLKKELVEELKVGDWVEVIGPNERGERVHIGHRFQIDQVWKDEGLYSKRDVPYLYWYPASSLRKIPDQTIAEAQAELQANLDEATQTIRAILAPMVERQLREIKEQISLLSDAADDMDAGYEQRIGQIEKRLDSLLADYREEKQKRSLMADRIQGLEERYADSKFPESKIYVGDMVVRKHWMRKVVIIESGPGMVPTATLSDDTKIPLADLIKV